MTDEKLRTCANCTTKFNDDESEFDNFCSEVCVVEYNDQMYPENKEE